MATEEITISELELADEVLADMTLPRNKLVQFKTDEAGGRGAPGRQPLVTQI